MSYVFDDHNDNSEKYIKCISRSIINKFIALALNMNEKIEEERQRERKREEQRENRKEKNTE